LIGTLSFLHHIIEQLQKNTANQNKQVDLWFLEGSRVGLLKWFIGDIFKPHHWVKEGGEG